MYIKAMVADLAPKMELQANYRPNFERKFGRRFIVQEPLKEEMSREHFESDEEILYKVIGKIQKEREDEKKASREKMFKRLKKIAFWGCIIFGATIATGIASSALSGRNKKDEPKNQWEVEPISLTSEDMSGPFEHKPDWIHTQEEIDSDGNSKGETIFYGYNDDESNTDWYDSDGCLDCTTSTPSEDSPKWEVDIADGNVIQID